MKALYIFFLCMIGQAIAHAQVSKSGVADFSWGQSKDAVIGALNCHGFKTQQGFEYCELKNSDSLFLGKYRYSFCNLRFYNAALTELHFDFSSIVLANLIADFTSKYGSPIVLEKKKKSADAFEMSIGYKWIIGDTEVLFINDGPTNPGLAIFSSVSLSAKYPKTIISLEKLIFE